MNLEDLLAQMAGAQPDKTSCTREQAHATMDKYLKLTPDFAAGDYIERNEMGKRRYAMPKPHQVAVCVKMLDAPMIDREGDLCDAVMAVACDVDKVLTFPINSRYYKKAEASRNISIFRRK